MVILQVGSFVWTHLTNLMESSDPANRYVQQILNDATLAKDFDLDKRKFSRNYEGSFYLEKLNTGAKVCITRELTLALPLSNSQLHFAVIA